MARVVEPTQAAYIAGLIDGEGSIMLVPRTNGGVHLRVVVSNTYLPVLEWLTAELGVGNVYHMRGVTEKTKASYAWRCHGDGAESLLKQIRPYLIIKAAQADLALTHHAALRTPALKADRTWQSDNRRDEDHEQARSMMPTLNRQMCSAENGLAYVSVDYDSGSLIADRVRYANTSDKPVLFFVNDPTGVEVFRTTVAPGTAEQSLAIPIPRRWNVDGPSGPTVNCAS